MTFWSVKNVQKYYNCINPIFINCQEILFHAALEVLRAHYLNDQSGGEVGLFIKSKGGEKC